VHTIGKQIHIKTRQASNPARAQATITPNLAKPSEQYRAALAKKLHEVVAARKTGQFEPEMWQDK